MDAQPELITLYPVFKRICARCGRRIRGYGYYTLYGYLTITNADGTTLRRHCCGEPVHHHCPAANAPYRIPISDELPVAKGVWRNIAPGIDYNAVRQRYAARVTNKRLGTHPTIEAAEHARLKYIRQKEHPHGKPTAHTATANRRSHQPKEER